MIGDLAGTICTGNQNTILGSACADTLTTGAENVIIGYNADAGTNSFGESIIIGAGAINKASNQAVFGSSTAKATDVFFGGGAQMTTPTLYSIHGTGSLAGTDSNLPGANIGLSGGAGTGTAGTTAGTGASVVVTYPLITSTGTAAQAFSTTTLAYVGGTMYVATADATVAADGADATLIGTGVGTLTLEAGFFRPGRRIRITANGLITFTAAGPTLTVEGRLGGTVVSTGVSVSVPPAVTAYGIHIDTQLTCRTAGATGTIYGSGYFNAISAVVGQATISEMDKTATTIDTTASQVIDLFGTWSANTAGNTVTITDVMVEILN
jgi:hypothetical protein